MGGNINIIWKSHVPAKAIPPVLERFPSQDSVGSSFSISYIEADWELHELVLAVAELSN